MKIIFLNITILLLLFISTSNIEAGLGKIYNLNFSDSLIVDTTRISIKMDSLIIDSVDVDTTA